MLNIGGLQDGPFARLSNNFVEVFPCPKVEAVLQVTKHCYQDEDLFIDIDTGVLPQSSPVRSFSSFSLWILQDGLKVLSAVSCISERDRLPTNRELAKFCQFFFFFRHDFSTSNLNIFASPKSSSQVVF